MAFDQLINFANRDLQTRIGCTALSIDGYEVENLLVKNQLTFRQQTCFMSEYYIKCPVEVVLSFPCLLDISAIIIEPKVSSHRSRCFEIYTAFQKPLVMLPVVNTKKDQRGLTKDETDENSTENTSPFPCKFTKDLLDTNIRQNERHLLNMVGRYSENKWMDNQPDQIVFVNGRHCLPYSHFPRNSFKCELKSYVSTRSCSHLVIKITWATIPVIRKLEIWGTPSIINPKNVTSHIYNLLSFQHTTTVVDNPIKEKNIVIKNAEIVKDIEVATGIDVPEEFIDPITFSIMTVPLLLPSGNTVDRSTLDKYVIEEEKHGRLPSDPYTGVVFHGSKQPVPNTSLKSRIDQFLLKNNSVVEHDGLTTGLKSINVIKTIDTLKLNTVSSSTAIRKRKLETAVALVHKKNVVSHQLTAVYKTISSSTNAKSACRTTHGHENDLKQSLDSSLFSTLSSLPVQSSVNNANNTACCRCDTIEKRVLFKLPCFHHCCRTCLQFILNTDKKCCNCAKAFERMDVTKLN